MFYFRVNCSKTTKFVQCYGGRGGGSFNEFFDACHANVRKIYIRAGRLIDSIQVTYENRHGKQHLSHKYGGNGGGRYDIVLRNKEIIIGVFGKTGRLVDQLGFISNQGRIFGPFGGRGGRSFRVQGCLLRGIFGASGRLLDRIGFYCSKVKRCNYW